VSQWTAERCGVRSRPMRAFGVRLDDEAHPPTLCVAERSEIDVHTVRLLKWTRQRVGGLTHLVYSARISIRSAMTGKCNGKGGTF